MTSSQQSVWPSALLKEYATGCVCGGSSGEIIEANMCMVLPLTLLRKRIPDVLPVSLFSFYFFWHKKMEWELGQGLNHFSSFCDKIPERTKRGRVCLDSQLPRDYGSSWWVSQLGFLLL